MYISQISVRCNSYNYWSSKYMAFLHLVIFSGTSSPSTLPKISTVSLQSFLFFLDLFFSLQLLSLSNMLKFLVIYIYIICHLLQSISSKRAGIFVCHVHCSISEAKKSVLASQKLVHKFFIELVSGSKSERWSL